MVRPTEKKKKRLSRVGIKWKMFAILVVFILVVIAVIWLFQVKLLDYFYKNIKIRELKSTAQEVEPLLGDDNAVFNKVYENADKYSSYIRVFRIAGGTAEEIVSADGEHNPLMPFITKRDLNLLYEKAVENGGVYVATISPKYFSDTFYSDITNNEDVIKNLPENEERSENDSVSAVYVQITQKGEIQYLTLQMADLSPLQATVSTLNRQFLWIGIVLVVLALGLAFIMSRVITKPIIKMNKAAQKLARGKYDADFSGKGYREICELAEALDYAAEELSKNDRLQKELISNISHDLRTPLTMIKGYGEIMRDIPGENTSENVQVIIDETERLTSLVNDMLDISKIQSGTRKPEKSVFSLTATIRETMLRYEKLTMQGGYRIEFIADCNVSVMADRIMILQVVYNLINNAINYTGEDKYVSVRQTVSGTCVRISVTDTGIGIEEKELPLIWDRYYKVDRVHKRATVGTGLGLSIVKGILDMHGAKYGVQSMPGKGSTFWFELQAVHPETTVSGEII